MNTSYASPGSPTSDSAVQSSRLQKFFKEYASFHKTPGNKVCHYFGIPVIVLSLLGMLGQFPIAGGLTGSEFLRLDGGTLLLLGAGIWYLFLDWKLALPYGVCLLGLYFLGRAMSLQVNAALFVLAWGIQFLGHLKYEKKKPAFLQNLEHLLIGPLWIFAHVIRYKP